MINILSKNESKKNTDAYSMNVVKEMLQNVMANRNKILKKMEIEHVELYHDIDTAFGSARCNTKASKLIHAEMSQQSWWLLFSPPHKSTSEQRNRSIFYLIELQTLI